MPIVQDMPPVGGFPSIRIQRRLPSTGPTGVAIFAVGGAVMAYGYYQVLQGLRWKGTKPAAIIGQQLGVPQTLCSSHVVVRDQGLCMRRYLRSAACITKPYSLTV